MVGFVTSESAEKIEMRDIAGQSHSFKISNIKSRTELKISPLILIYLFSTIVSN